MKILGAILIALIVLIQYPLWLGKGGWLRAWQLEHEVAKQNSKNAQLESRNAALGAEVRDLKQGTEAIEERARSELGMIRPDEVFYEYVPEKPPAKSGSEPD
jgi:cell division protein FtsB